MSSLILVVDDEADVEMLLRQQWCCESGAQVYPLGRSCIVDVKHMLLWSI
jgi:hypothetical protein